MADAENSLRLDKRGVIHMTRITVAVLLSLVFAHLFKLPESYWAAITTVVVIQSTLGATLTVSWHRLIGTAIGAAAGALCGTYFGPNTVVFTIGIFVLGVICAVLRLDRTSYRFAAITLAITMLVAYQGPTWIVSLHRFVEVSMGIAVGLVITAIWPEPEAETSVAVR